MKTRRPYPVKEPDYYLNASGLMVFTRTYHLKRGYCCGNGCLHCPYNHVNVPEKEEKDDTRRVRDAKR